MTEPFGDDPAPPGDSVVPLESIACTEELSQRPARPPEYAKQMRALQSLAQAMADSPQTILQTLAETVLELLNVHTAVVSVLTDDAQGFVWPAIAGAWQPYIGGGAPRQFSPCGDVLDLDSPLLLKRLERRYTALRERTPVAEECLLVPFRMHGVAVGTIWAVTHDQQRIFDTEDLRLLESLGACAAAAVQAHNHGAFEEQRLAVKLDDALDARTAMATVNAELHASQSALRHSEGDFRDFLEDAAIGMHWVAADGTILWANQTELDLLGYTREEYVGQHITTFYADQPVMADFLARLNDREVLHDYGASLRAKDGSIRHVLISSRAHAENGQFVHTRAYTRDITARMEADAATQASEAFNRSIIDSSPDCIKVLDLSGALLSMHNGDTLLGISDCRPFLHTSWINFWDGADREQARAAVAEAVMGGEGHFVGFFRTLRDEPKWWEVRVTPILDVHGNAVRLLAVSRDVTDTRHAQTNLTFLASISGDLLQWNTVNDMMSTIGARLSAHLQLSTCAFVEISESAEQVTIAHDWHREDIPSLIGVHRLTDFVEDAFIRKARSGEIIVVNDVAADPNTDPAKFAAFSIASFICVPLIRDRQWLFALCLYKSDAYAWRDDEIELARDLTERIWTRLERLRAEERMRISEARYRTLFNLMDEGYCVIEMLFDAYDTPVDFRYLEVNPSFEKQSGQHGVLGKRILEIAPEMEAHWFEAYGRVAVTGEPVRFTNESKQLNKWFDVYAFRIGEPEARKVAVIFTDVTSRAITDEALRKSALAMVDLDRRKDEFLALLGHELRNPLAPISNAIQLMRLQPSDNPVHQRAHAIIERQVGQLTHLVDDLLEISRISTGRIQLREERIPISAVVERALETTQPSVLQHRHALTVSLPPEPIWLFADVARLEQVIVNLLANAVKYTDDGGQISLTVEQDGQTAVLRVRDNGIGISAELLPNIFELFTQAHRSLDRSQGGLGIGLSLVHRIVALHGGTVTASSTLGQWSEFVVRLPALDVAVSTSVQPAAEAVKPVRTGCGVLIVDDNVDAAQSLALLLNVYGHDVLLAYDGPTALDMALQFRPDVMVLDIGLPGLTGLEVATKIREQPTLTKMVLIAVTGYGLEADRQRSTDAGFDHHLVKPADFTKLQAILTGVCQSGMLTPADRTWPVMS